MKKKIVVLWRSPGKFVMTFFFYYFQQIVQIIFATNNAKVFTCTPVIQLSDYLLEAILFLNRLSMRFERKYIFRKGKCYAHQWYKHCLMLHRMEKPT